MMAEMVKETPLCDCVYLVCDDEAGNVPQSGIIAHSSVGIQLGSHTFCKCCLGKDRMKCPVHRDIKRSYPPEEADPEVYKYQMTSKPRGLCLIISNKNFGGVDRQGRDHDRHGTERDVESLSKVFSWLGFRVLMCVDKTATGMQQVLKLISKGSSQLQRCGLYEYQNGGYSRLKNLPQHGDAFVCCILSHGGEEGVCGTDGGEVPIDCITSPFNGENCPELRGRPKAFFIQACRGGKHMQTFRNDYLRDVVGDSAGGMMQEIVTFHPSEADFLIVRSTVQTFVSYRNRDTGSTFIQTLCSQLISDCPSEKDILSILTKVNNKVSQKVRQADGSETTHPTTQVTETRTTLRKLLVFPVQQA